MAGSGESGPDVPGQRGLETGCVDRDAAGRSCYSHAKAIATRLIALLPRQIVINLGAPKEAQPAGNSADIRFIMTIIIMNAFFMAFSFGSQYFSGNHSPQHPHRP
jgi:hypothetical protein